MKLASPLGTSSPKCQISRPDPTRPDPSRVTRCVTRCVTAVRRLEASGGTSAPLLRWSSPTASRRRQASATQKAQKREMRVPFLTYPPMPPKPLKGSQGLASLGLERVYQ